MCLCVCFLLLMHDHILSGSGQNLARDILKPGPHQQQCRSNIRLCGKDEISTQNSFDIVSVPCAMIKLAISSAFERTLIYRIVSYHIVLQNTNGKPVLEVKFLVVRPPEMAKRSLRPKISMANILKTTRKRDMLLLNVNRKSYAAYHLSCLITGNDSNGYRGGDISLRRHRRILHFQPLPCISDAECIV